MKIPKIQNIELKNKKVLLRADLNVPLQNNLILDDFKLKSSLPTIDYLLKQNCKIVIATHLGRPNGTPEELSTKILTNWFLKAGYKASYAKTISDAKNDNSQIVLLENLRFFSGEKSLDKSFASDLASLGEIFINDAFGTLHRKESSIVLVPKLFDYKSKAFGLLVEKEIEHLSKLKENPKKPLILVLGGAKVADKIPLILSFLKSEAKPNAILIGGLIAATFIACNGTCVGKTKVDKDSYELARQILTEAQIHHVKIHLPKDNIVIDHEKNSSVEKTGYIKPTSTIVDIGSATIEDFGKKISESETIFCNGTMGLMYEYSDGTNQILKLIADSNATSIIGGGDITAAVNKFNLSSKFNFLSTGGGATLAFLSEEKWEGLPGISAFFN